MRLIISFPHSPRPRRLRLGPLYNYRNNVEVLTAGRRAESEIARPKMYFGSVDRRRKKRKGVGFSISRRSLKK